MDKWGVNVVSAVKRVCRVEHFGEREWESEGRGGGEYVDSKLIILQFLIDCFISL